MDNFFQTSPPKMQDMGRYLTDFRSSGLKDQYFKKINNIHRNDEYRMYLQSHTKKIIDDEWAQLQNKYVVWENTSIFTHPTRSSMNDYIVERKLYDSRSNLPIHTVSDYPPYKIYSKNF